MGGVTGAVTSLNCSDLSRLIIRIMLIATPQLSMSIVSSVSAEGLLSWSAFNRICNRVHFELSDALAGSARPALDQHCMRQTPDRTLLWETPPPAESGYRGLRRNRAESLHKGSPQPGTPFFVASEWQPSGGFRSGSCLTEIKVSCQSSDEKVWPKVDW